MIDYEFYRHIVDDIVTAALGDYEACLALRPVCKTFKLQVDTALGQHIQLTRPVVDTPAETDPERETQSAHSNGDYVHDEASEAEATQWSSIVRTSTFALDTNTSPANAIASVFGPIDTDDPPPLLVQTSTGNPVPSLYPSSSPRPGGRWPGLGRALAHTRIVDLTTYLRNSERSALFPALRRVDTLRFVRVNHAEFKLGALTCRRYVGMVILGPPSTYPHWDTFFPEGTLPTIKNKLVLNIVLPQRTKVPQTIFHSPWRGREPNGDWNMVFIFCPIDTVVPFHAGDFSPEPPRTDFGVVLNVFIHVLDIATKRTYTLVGLEEVEWHRLGVSSPPTSTKEQYFRAALEELIVPVLGLEKGMINIDEIQGRIKFVSLAEYRANVGGDECDTDLLDPAALFTEADLESVQQMVVRNVG